MSSVAPEWNAIGMLNIVVSVGPHTAVQTAGEGLQDTAAEEF